MKRPDPFNSQHLDVDLGFTLRSAVRRFTPRPGVRWAILRAAAPQTRDDRRLLHRLFEAEEPTARDRGLEAFRLEFHRLRSCALVHFGLLRIAW